MHWTLPTISFLITIALTLTSEIATAEERFVHVPSNPSILVDSQDIFIQDHIDPAIRAARVVTVDTLGDITNMFGVYANCRTNGLGTFLILNSQRDIIWAAQDDIELTPQEQGTQTYEIVRIICTLTARSGSSQSANSSESQENSRAWVSLPETYHQTDPGCTDESGEPCTGFLSIDEHSLLNIRGALNFEIADVTGNIHHLVVICDPAHPRYGDVIETAINDVPVEHEADFDPVQENYGVHHINLFVPLESLRESVCSRYGHLQHGEIYQPNR